MGLTEWIRRRGERWNKGWSVWDLLDVRFSPYMVWRHHHSFEHLQWKQYIQVLYNIMNFTKSNSLKYFIVKDKTNYCSENLWRATTHNYVFIHSVRLHTYAHSKKTVFHILLLLQSLALTRSSWIHKYSLNNPLLFAWNRKNTR